MHGGHRQTITLTFPLVIARISYSVRAGRIAWQWARSSNPVSLVFKLHGPAGNCTFNSPPTPHVILCWGGLSRCHCYKAKACGEYRRPAVRSNHFWELMGPCQYIAGSYIRHHEVFRSSFFHGAYSRSIYNICAPSPARLVGPR